MFDLFTAKPATEKLEINEAFRLGELETVISRGLKTFIDVGNALLEIRESRLYRGEFGTFENYCQEKWGMDKRYANYQIQAAMVVENLGTIVPNVPRTESQARPLATLEPEQQREAWKQAVETAPEGKITAAHVQSVVDEIQNKPHVSFNTGENEWYTPVEFINAARVVLGEIDLDPASSSIANKTVCASVYYSKEDDGLEKQWSGRVWMNPPYAKDLIGRFAAKFSYHAGMGNITGIVLVNNSTETKWFLDIAGVCSAVVFPTSRVKFLEPDGTPGAPLQGQAILYSGPQPDLFLSEFKKFGWGAKL